MSAFNDRYPQELAKVIGHAKRLMKVLAQMERGRSDAWFRGRAAELRGVVSYALADLRSGASDTEAAGKAIASYVDSLHRGASRKLRCGVALECCALDEVITAVAPDEWGSMALGEPAGASATLATGGPTTPAGWVDSAEMLARVQAGLALVDALARGMARRVGNRVATTDDLRAFGREGLLDAARAFDEGRGVPFERWATLRIRNAMIDGVRRWGAVPPRARRRQGLEAEQAAPRMPEGQGRSEGFATSDGPAPRVLLVADAGDAPNALGEDDDGRGLTPEDLLERAERAALVRELVARLPDRERALIEQSYFHGLTLEQAATSMGLSRSWAHRVHARAIEGMERELRKRERAAVRAGRPQAARRA